MAIEWDKNTDNLLAIALEKFDSNNLPVIRVIETEDRSWMFTDDDAAPENETHTFEIDFQKLVTVMDWDDFRLGYVYHILENALKGKTDARTSKKYSFSDTPEWWKEILADNTTGRTIIETNVDIN